MKDPRLYVQTALRVRQQIADGSLEPGNRVPSITALRKETKQSRKTVAKALQLLESEKLLRRIPGHGYIVDDDAIDHLPQPPN